MLHPKHVAGPTTIPIAGVFLALLLTSPTEVDTRVNCPQLETSSVVADVRSNDAGVRDVVDYPEPAPLEWNLGVQEPEALEVSENAQVEDGGLTWLVLREGDRSRATPDEGAVARMRFVGWSADGKPLPGARALTMVPMDVPLDEMTTGFARAAQKMHPGERRRVWIPEELAWKGQQGRPSGTIIYDMELVSWRAH